MVDENIIQAEKDYLVNVLGKELINCEWSYDKSVKVSNTTRLYPHQYLARLFWPQEYNDNVRKHVHHINFNHHDNRVSNLVVLTCKEHRLIHKLFDPKWKEQYRKSACTHRVNGKNRGKNNGMYRNGYKISGKNNGMYGKSHHNPHKGQTWRVVNGKRIWMNK